MKIKIKKDDNILVIAGEHKGSEGKVVKIIREKNRAIVEGVNMIKKHEKPQCQNPQGGIIEKKRPSMFLNLSLVSSEGNATRVGFRIEEDGKKVRFAKKNNEVV